MPGQANIVSVTSAPEKRAPNSSATMVTMGMVALRSAWRQTTRPSPSPLARAVRT